MNVRGLSAPRIVHAGRPARLAGAGLQHHQPVVHLLQHLLVDGLGDVGQLVGVSCHVVDFHEHLQEENAPPPEPRYCQTV